MKKLIIALMALSLLPAIADAQVEKQVEMTKEYAPTVERASKLAVMPDMTDTVQMRPDIDYVITPLSLETSLATRPIAPAKVTYWEFNRPLPFYVKAGVGYPLNSVFDFYASTQNPSTGYVVGYLNHKGRFGDIKNNFGAKHNSVEMHNAGGAAAGKYIGRHILEGGASYSHNLFHRYGTRNWPATEEGAQGWRPVAAYGDLDFHVRFGDEFRDLSRTNFDVSFRGNMFFDNSEWGGYKDKARENTLDVSAKVARLFGRYGFSLNAGYERVSGNSSIDVISRTETGELNPHKFVLQTLRVGGRFIADGNFLKLVAGVDFYHEDVKGGETGNFLIPYARADFNFGTKALRPFAEVDGGVYNNGYRSLMHQNPYVVNAVALEKSSVNYNARFGLTGAFAKNRIDYRVYAGFSVHDDHLFWLLNRDGVFTPILSRQTVTSFNAEMAYRPIEQLRFDLGVHGYIYNDESCLYGERRVSFNNGEPDFRGDIGMRYEGKKISFGVKALFESERKWSKEIMAENAAQTPEAPQWVLVGEKCGAYVDLQVDFEWQLKGRFAIFAEGRNLINRRIYRLPYFPEYGANFTAGVKFAF